MNRSAGSSRQEWRALVLFIRLQFELSHVGCFGCEPLPIRPERADAAARAVRGDEQRVEPEQCRPAVLWMLVAGQVFVERRARGHGIYARLCTNGFSLALSTDYA